MMDANFFRRNTQRPASHPKQNEVNSHSQLPYLLSLLSYLLSLISYLILIMKNQKKKVSRRKNTTISKILLSNRWMILITEQVL